jgi:hypothetical protein
VLGLIGVLWYHQQQINKLEQIFAQKQTAVVVSFDGNKSSADHDYLTKSLPGLAANAGFKVSLVATLPESAEENRITVYEDGKCYHPWAMSNGTKTTAVYIAGGTYLAGITKCIGPGSYFRDSGYKELLGALYDSVTEQAEMRGLIPQQKT